MTRIGVTFVCVLGGSSLCVCTCMCVCTCVLVYVCVCIHSYPAYLLLAR